MEKRSEIADLESQVAAFERELNAATAELDHLKATRPRVLLEGTDAELKSHDEAQNAAQRAGERAAAKKTDAEQRLATAKDLAAQAEAAALKAEADAAANDAAAVIKKAFGDIRKAVAKARDRLSAAEETIAAANRQVSEDEHPVVSVEARVFAGADLPMEIISEKPAPRWIYESGAAVPADKLPKIIVDKDDHFAGQIRWEGQNHGLDRVVCRNFRRCEFLPRVSGRRPSDLEQTLRQIEEIVTIEEVHDDRTPQVEWYRMRPDEEVREATETKAA